jgi:hypothetical protein
VHSRVQDLNSCEVMSGEGLGDKGVLSATFMTFLT